MKVFWTYFKIISIKLRFLSAIIVCNSAFFSLTAIGQFGNTEKMYQGIILDEVMIKAVAGGFDVKSFIDKVKKDTTFYKAFKTLHLLSYHMYNDISIEDKKQNVKASYHGISRQAVKDHCRTMTIMNEKVEGDFFKKKREYRYYTAKLYAHLFFTMGKICNENNIVGNRISSGTSKYEEQLRMLIFNPGKRIQGIPGIGENVAIFDPPTFNKYKFRLTKTFYNGEECYVFKASPKEMYADGVVINELKTWFRVKDFAIVARNYSLSFKTLFYDFDVQMQVKLKNIRNYLVPYEINYKGNWHVFTKPREIAHFTAIFTDFE